MNNTYNKDSIESLDPRSFTRLRPGVYCGSTEYSTQLVVELFSNALDEFNIGHGNIIKVDIDKNNVITVQDEGQGFPVNEIREEDGKTVLEAAFSVLNTSGKYRDDGVYEGTSLGLNGIGSKLANFLSTHLSVQTWNGKETETVFFQDGLFEDRECFKSDHPRGTKVEFKPDPQFFRHAEPDIKYLRQMFNDICSLCPELTIIFNREEIRHPEGISYIIQEKVGKDIEICKPLYFQEQEDKYKLDCGITYTTSSSSNIVAYVNYGLTDAGPHITTIKSCITRALNKWAKEQGLLKEKDKNLDGNSLQEGMILVFNLIAPSISYDAQTKSRIVSNEFTPFLNDIFSKQLELWLDNNPVEGKAIIEKALLARKASEAAKKAREAIKNKKQLANKPKIMNPDKLKDAEYLGEDSTLLVVEGLSAGASMAVARDQEKYGILMLRGKLINAFTNSNDKLLKNEEIQLLFKALNITPDSYDSSKLRYGKVAICVDSDSDGDNIALLIMTALQHFCPQFIQEGRLCWLRSPLYIVKTGNEQEQYFFTDKEMNQARGKIKGEVQRNKGLGSLSAEQAKASMFGENQKMDVLIPDEESIELLQQLMGKSVTPRKDFIFKNIDFSEVRE